LACNSTKEIIVLKKILFIAAHRKDRAPGQRFRFEQYFDYLNANGYSCDLSFIINENDDKVLYSKGRYFDKVMIALKSAGIRLKDVLRRNDYDIIFVFREGFLTGTVLFEELLSKSKAKMVFDFDDAIWHFDVSEANKSMGWLKNPGKTARLISFADIIFAGNQYLADYAKHHNDNVVIVPTTIDTDEYVATPFVDKKQICIGWSGSVTTIKHFEMAIPFLKILKAKYGERIKIKVIGDKSYTNHELNVSGIGWSREAEIIELSEIDIGIMPLPNDEWAKGKCGLKGLQYMALKIATVMSPVGVNTDIIQDGVNGFLADKTEEWVEKLSLLIEDSNLRRTLADNGRTTVLEKYSVKANAPLYLKYFNELTK
jgi:glycosyltransferase involved in cell wall biosynthesis